MIEKGLAYNRYDSIISLRIELQRSGILINIQDEYLYWDKAKYKAKEYNSVQFWSALKLRRQLDDNYICFGSQVFF